MIGSNNSYLDTIGDAEITVQSVDSYNKNGYKRPRGKRWEMTGAIADEDEDKVVSYWYRRVPI
jgi:hypothetical protein